DSGLHYHRVLYMIKPMSRPILDPGGGTLIPPSNWVPVTLAAIGTVLVSAVLLLISAVVLKYVAGISWLYDELAPALRYLDSPMIPLGSLILAGLINTPAVLRLGTRGHADDPVKTRLWNLWVLGMSALLLAGLLGYLFRENFVAR